jgi:cytochrome c oxidase subunit 2
LGLITVKRWKSGKRAIMLVLLLSLALAGCSVAEQATPLNPKGSVGEDQLFLIQLSLGIMTFVLVVVFVIFFYVIIRYRQRRGQTGIPKQVEGSHKLEITWTVIPLILLTILAVPTVQKTFALAKDYSEANDVLKVKVTGHQFWWEFEYTDLGIVTSGDLYIPVGQKVFVTVQSADVAHSFWVPGLAGKIDAIPGVTNKMYFDAKEPGVYRGACAELCGASHALMDFKVIAVSEDEFEQWVEDMQTPVAESDAVRGQELFEAKGCLQCHAITPDGKSMGPNLNNFANRDRVASFRPNTEEWLAKWLDDPQEVKPGSTMPDVGLTQDEIDALVEYLYSLDNQQ